MSVLSLVSAYAFIMVAAWLGVRLLLMWRQTRKLPELLFGMSFTLSMVGTSLSAADRARPPDPRERMTGRSTR